MYTGASKILKCVYANARSIVSKEKRAELELIVGTENPDLIGNTETWAKKSIQNYELMLNNAQVNAQLLRKDREVQKESGLGAGGKILYVKDCIKYVIKEDFQFENFKESIYLDKFKLLVRVLEYVTDHQISKMT